MPAHDFQEFDPHIFYKQARAASVASRIAVGNFIASMHVKHWSGVRGWRKRFTPGIAFKDHQLRMVLLHSVWGTKHGCQPMPADASERTRRDPRFVLVVAIAYRAWRLGEASRDVVEHLGLRRAWPNPDAAVPHWRATGLCACAAAPFARSSPAHGGESQIQSGSRNAILCESPAARHSETTHAA